MEIPRPSKTCSVSGRELLPGEPFYSLLTEKKELTRQDVAVEHWNGPPVDFFGWWKTKVPESGEKKIRLAPNDILLDLFDQLRSKPEQGDMLYVLSLLLIRRRLLRYEREEENEQGQKMMIVYALKENVTFEIPMAMPDRERLEEVQEQLTQLLYN